VDELTIVRELRPEVEPLPQHVRYRTRAELRYDIAYERARPSRPRRLVAMAAAAALLAAATAVVVVDDEVRDPERVVGRDPGTGLGPSSIPSGDQFIYTREVLYETPVSGSGVRERFVDEKWRSINGLKPGIDSERGRSWRSAPVGEGVWPPRSYEALSRLPTDPDALSRAVREEAGDDEAGFWQLQALLVNWAVMPPGLRTAAFDAVTGLPGVELIEGDTDARGRRGIGIVRDGPRFDSHIVVDAETYEYLGFRDRFVRQDGVTVDRVSALVKRGIVDRVGERP
jgi:hypothetical protein